MPPPFLLLQLGQVTRCNRASSTILFTSDRDLICQQHSRVNNPANIAAALHHEEYKELEGNPDTELDTKTEPPLLHVLHG